MWRQNVKGSNLVTQKQTHKVLELMPRSADLGVQSWELRHIQVRSQSQKYKDGHVFVELLLALFAHTGQVQLPHVATDQTC